MEFGGEAHEVLPDLELAVYSRMALNPLLLLLQWRDCRQAQRQTAFKWFVLDLVI